MAAPAFTIKKAERAFGKIVACFKGMSGSGKTYSALIFARGLVGPNGKIVVIDTEGRRALMYAGDPLIGEFEHMEFDAPYSSERTAEAIKTAAAAGADAIIFDSASHEHEAEGGMLWFADQEDERLRKADKYGNDPGMRKWIKPKMEHNRFIRTAVSVKPNVIFCIRQTQTTEMQDVTENGRTKKKAVVIVNDVCEKNLEFDMDIVIELERESHRAKFIKVPKPYLAAISNGDVITVQHGARFAEVMSDKPKPKANQPETQSQPTKTEEKTPEGNQPEQVPDRPRDFEVLLAKGDPYLFADFESLHDWFVNNIGKLKSLENLQAFEERNKNNFLHYASLGDVAEEWMTLINDLIKTQKGMITNGK